MEMNKGNKYNINDKVYHCSIDMREGALISEMTISGIIKRDDGIFYSNGDTFWRSEAIIYKTRKEAYKNLIQQAENEMNAPECTIK